MTNTELPEPDTIRALDAVTSGHSTTSRRRWMVAVGAVAAVAAAVTALVVPNLLDDDGRPSPMEPPSPSTSQSPDPGAVVDVEWGYAHLSDPVTFDDMAQNLREHGLGEWVEPLHDTWGDVDGRIKLDFNQGELTASIPGTPASHTNNYVVFRHFLMFEGSDSQFEATATEIDGGGQRLTLTLTKSETAPTDGIPGEVYERALYTTVPFNEIPSPSPAELSPGTYQSNPVRFRRIARDLGSSVEPLRERWGNADEPVQIRLELNAATATLSIPGTQITFTGRYTTDGSLIRIDDDDPQADNGWIELASRPYGAGSDTLFFYSLWDAGPAAWNGLPAEVIWEVFFQDTHFTPTGE